MQKPIIAIVGRPNVGKSALFNRICKKRIAIVDEEEGITRDRIYADGDFFGHRFTLVDTAGIDESSKIDFHEALLQQTKLAVAQADAIIFVVDGMVGSTLLDQEVAKFLLRQKKPIFVAVNKIDDSFYENKIYEFQDLGFAALYAVSAVQGRQIDNLLEKILSLFPNQIIEEKETSSLETKIAIIGRPNVGKSTLLNCFCEEPRVVTSPIANTTRDSIDVQITKGDKIYTFIDTAGIRRKMKEKQVVEKFSSLRTKKAIDQSTICLLLIDAKEGITVQEKKIAKDIHDKRKACIVVINKWDLIKNFRQEHCLLAIKKQLPFLRDYPIMFISAKTGKNVANLFSTIDEIQQFYHKRISTSQLNKFIENAMQQLLPPMLQGKRLRIYYMTQVTVAPPKFILFVNYPSLFMASYKKYLVNNFRKQFGFEGIPISFFLKKREKEFY